VIWTTWLKNAQTKPDYGTCAASAGGFCPLLLVDGCAGHISRSRDSVRAWMRPKKDSLWRDSTGVCTHHTIDLLPRYSSCR